VTYQYQNYLPKSDAVKIEIAITRPDGTVVRLVCDSFDYIEVEKFMEPQYIHQDMFDPWSPRYMQPPRTARLVFTIDRPRTWTVYSPHIEQPSIDDGTVVEEASE
jgi:hypothetical protein